MFEKPLGPTLALADPWNPVREKLAVGLSAAAAYSEKFRHLYVPYFILWADDDAAGGSGNASVTTGPFRPRLAALGGRKGVCYLE